MICLIECEPWQIARSHSLRFQYFHRPASSSVAGKHIVSPPPPQAPVLFFENDESPGLRPSTSPGTHSAGRALYLDRSSVIICRIGSITVVESYLVQLAHPALDLRPDLASRSRIPPGLFTHSRLPPFLSVSVLVSVLCSLFRPLGPPDLS